MGLLSTGMARGQEQTPRQVLEASLASIPKSQSRQALLNAWDEQEVTQVDSWAYRALMELYSLGKSDAGIALVDLVLGEYQGLPNEALFVSLRSELLRSQGRFDEALAGLASAEALARTEGYGPVNAALQSIHGHRSQIWLDLGLLQLAALEAAREATASKIIADQCRESYPDYAAGVELASAYRSASMQLAMRSHGEVLETLRVLESRVLPVFPQLASAIAIRRAQAMVPLAREIQPALSGADQQARPAQAMALLIGVLDRWQRSQAAPAENPEQADPQQLAPEEIREAYLTLADACWLVGDHELGARQIAALKALKDEDESTFTSEKLARLAAFQARLRLAEKAEPALLRLALQDLQTAFEAVEAEWNAVQRPPEGVGFLHFDEQCLVVEMWVRLLLALEGPKRGAELGFEVLARAHGIGTLTQHLGGTSSNSAQLARVYRRSLPKGAGILAFLPSFDHSLVFLADAKGVSVENLPSRNALEKNLQDWINLTRRRPRAKRDRSARVGATAELVAKQLLPAPVSKRLQGWDRVLVVGTDLLGSPGLECLPLGEGSVGDQVAISYLPSLPLAELLRRRIPAKRWPAKDLLVLAASGLDQGPPLELLNDEAKLLQSLAGKKNLLLGESAHLQGGPFDEHDLLAIVCHGKYDPMARRPAQMHLAGGLRDGNDLENTPQPLLTCLLTCGAARGPRVRGDAGTVHLGGAAIRGGAAAVLLAETDIEVGASLDLFEKFIQRMRAGDGPDLALRNARQQLTETDPKWRDPYYASSLRIFGQGFVPGS